MLSRGLDYGFGGHIQPLVRELKNMGVEVNIIDAGGDLAAATYLLNHAVDADLVHCQGSYVCPLHIKLSKITTVHTLIEDEARYLAWSPKTWLGQQLEQKTLQTSDAVISVNPELNHKIRRITNAPIYTVPNCVDTEEFNTPITKRLNYLLTGGRHIRRKNFAELTQALKNTNLPPLYIFGGGPLTEKLKQTLRPQDHMLGYTDRHAQILLYKQAAAFISTSHYETGPITILEAMAAGCPVISSDIPGVWTTIRNEETGLLYPLGNIDKLVHQIRRLTEDAELRHRLAENAYSYVCQHRRWEDAAKETIKVYEEAIKNT